LDPKNKKADTVSSSDLDSSDSDSESGRSHSIDSPSLPERLFERGNSSSPAIPRNVETRAPRKKNIENKKKMVSPSSSCGTLIPKTGGE
jgi:hypothetical protein